MPSFNRGPVAPKGLVDLLKFTAESGPEPLSNLDINCPRLEEGPKRHTGVPICSAAEVDPRYRLIQVCLNVALRRAVLNVG